MRAPVTEADPLAAWDVTFGSAPAAVSDFAGLPAEHATDVPINTPTRVPRNTDIIVASILFAVGDEVVLGRNYLPLPVVASLPGIGEPIASVEAAISSLAPQMQYAGNGLDVAELMNSHSLVARPADPVGPSHAPDHIAPAHQRSIFRINEVRSQQMLEGACVTLHHCGGPLILEPDRQHYSWSRYWPRGKRCRRRWRRSTSSLRLH